MICYDKSSCYKITNCPSEKAKYPTQEYRKAYTNISYSYNSLPLCENRLHLQHFFLQK